MSMILLDVLEHFELTWLDSLSHGPDSFTHYAWRSSIVSTASKEKRTKSVLKALKQLDESKMSGFHLKTVFTAGMGFFADAYDLFIIGVVSSLLKSLWHLNTFEISLLSSTALFAAAVSAIIFGR